MAARRHAPPPMDFEKQRSLSVHGSKIRGGSDLEHKYSACQSVAGPPLLCPHPSGGHFGIARSVRLSVCPMTQLPRL